MSALFGDTITLYNHYKAARVDYWQRTVITGVQYRAKTEKTVDSAGLHIANSVSVTIPDSADAGVRTYLAPVAFAADTAKTNHWSLDPAGNQDFIVFGAVTKDITTLYTIDALKAEYGYVTVKAVSDNTLRPRLKQWKVTAA
jgi:tRNA(Leu) C34 or U34 (ribose-2'-O)-methylase TrmL